MLCRSCYDAWLASRPVGLGAICLSCGDRRRDHLRHHELPQGFVVLCHNCCARAARLARPPKSEEGLLMRLERDRRQGERRVSCAPRQDIVVDRRRRGERRVGMRDLFDATHLAVLEDPGEAVAAPTLDEARAVLSDLKRDLSNQEAGEVTTVFDISDMTRVRVTI